MVRIFLFLSLVPLSWAWGQERAPLVPLAIDRPDISNMPITVTPGYYQFELGWENARNVFLKEMSIVNAMLRTGLGPRAELRLGMNALRTDSTQINTVNQRSYYSASVKYRLWEEKGARPSFALQPEVSVLYQGATYVKGEALYNIFLLFNNTLSDHFYLNYNVGFTRQGFSIYQYLLSASLGIIHTQRLGYFIEGYSINDMGGPFTFSFDGGLAFLLAPRFQVDIYGGRRYAPQSGFYFFGAGFGFRLDKGDLKRRSFNAPMQGIGH